MAQLGSADTQPTRSGFPQQALADGHTTAGSRGEPSLALMRAGGCRVTL